MRERDLARRHRRDARGRRDPDDPRGRDVARGGRRPRDGQDLRRGRRRDHTSTSRAPGAPGAAGSSPPKEGDWLSIDGTTGEVLVGQLPTRPPRSCRWPARKVARPGEVRHLPVVQPDRWSGRTGTAASESAPTPTRPTTRAWRSSSAPRGSASAAPSTCSSRRSGSWRSGEMILAENEADGGARRSRRSSRCSARTSSGSSARWGSGPSRSVCSIRRCTSSCPTRTRRREAAAELEMPAEKLQRARPALASEPDARAPRLPARHHVPRDLRDTGPGDLRGGGGGAREGLQARARKS